MKKVFTTTMYIEKHKKYNRTKIKKAKKRKYKFYDLNKPSLRDSFLKQMTTKYKDLQFPKNFSIINNPSEVLAFFDKLLIMIEEKVAVNLKMEDVDEITPDAILYLLSIFKEIEHSGIESSIKGNAPVNQKCKELFVKSGFYRYVKQHKKNNFEDKSIFTIKEGTNCLSSVAKDVISYVRKHLDMEDKPTKMTKDVYAIIIESMTNTFNHSSIDKDKAKWYLMAYHTQDEVHFTFLDSGLGIPKTLQTNFMDTIHMLKSLHITKDHQLILSALNGDFRTATKENKRGKGLPKIMRISKSNSIKESILVSNLGYVNCTNGTSKVLDTRFHGTLLSWKIVKGEVNENN